MWICRTANGHLQATGRDARARKQYCYHDEWRRVRDESKFSDLAEFGRALPDIRKRIDSDLSRPGLDNDKVVALVLALMDRTLIRVGNDEYRRQNGSHGLTTLVTRQVQVRGAQMRFTFPGKGGVRQEVRLNDRRLAAVVRRCHELGGREVFTYLDDDDRPRRIDSGECNDYLRDLVDDATVKTFRTWGGSAIAIESLATSTAEISQQEVVAAIDEAAQRLGNTRAVARRAYVHPAIAEHYLEGTLDAVWRSSRRTAELDRAERALLNLIG